MPEPIEQVAPTGDADFDAALTQAAAEPAAEPPAEPVAPEPVAVVPAAEPDFTFATLENGQREMRLATGQVYRGKDDAELYGQLARAQVAASKRITELSSKPEPVAPPPTTATATDPTAMAIADLMAPAFGVKNGGELVQKFAAQQEAIERQQEVLAAQAVNYEAANFFRAVPEFSKSQADADKIDGFCKERGLPPTAASFEMAYYTLKAKGEFSASATPTNPPTAPKNNMPPPPTGTAPANTGKGATTEADLWNMTSDQLEQLLIGSTPA